MATSKSAAPSQAPAPQQQAATKNRFIIIHGDKGGVGKSMVGQALGDYLISTGAKVAFIEADTRNPDVARMFNGNAPVAYTNVSNENGWMDVMDFTMKHRGYTFIMNTPAGVGNHMDSVASFARFLRDQDVEMQMELWWTMAVHHDSVNLLNEAFKAYGDQFHHVRVVCNLHYSGGDSSSQGPFVLWHESPLKAQIERKGGMTVNFPGLHIRVVAKVLDPKKIMPYSDAVDVALGEAIGLEHSERWKLTQWLKDCQAAFAPAFEAA